MIGKDKDRVVATVKKDIKKKIDDLAKEEQRTESAMAAIILECGLNVYKDIQNRF